MLPTFFGSSILAMRGYKHDLNGATCVTSAQSQDNSYPTDEEPYINLLDSLDAIKMNLNAHLFCQIQNLIDSIHGLSVNKLLNDYPPSESSLEDFPATRLIIKNFCNILVSARKSQYDLLRTLAEPLATYSDIASLKPEEYADVLRLLEIDTLMRDACHVPITFDGVLVSPLAQNVFLRLSHQI